MPSRTALSLLVGLSLLLPAAARADDVDVRVGRHDGFGRIMFDWPKPVDFTIRNEDRKTILAFDRPIQADLRIAAKHLPAYIVSTKIGPDGRSVEFTLNERFRTRPIRSGSSIGIDFINSDKIAAAPVTIRRAAAQPPAKSQEGKTPESGVSDPEKQTKPAIRASRVAAPEPVPADAPISFAETDRFTRVVLPWGDTKFKLEKRGDEFVLVFERALNPDLAPLRVQKPKGILSAHGKKANSRFGLHLRLMPGYSPRAFVEDGKVVLDLVAPEPAAPTKIAEEASKPVPETPPAPQKEEAQDRPATDTAVEHGEASPPASAQTADPTKPAEAAVAVKARELGTGTQLTVSWPSPVPGAVFIRGGHIWAVFGSTTKLDFSGMPIRTLKGIGTPAQLPNQPTTVLRVPLNRGFHARASAIAAQDGTGFDWVIDVVPEPAPVSSFSVIPEPHAIGGARLRIGAPGATGPFAIRDPDVGDRLIVVPMSPGLGLEQERRFVECALLDSVQGVVVEPRTDDLDVSAEAGAIIISTPRGMMLSDPPAATPMAAAAPVPTIVEARQENAEPSLEPRGPTQWHDGPIDHFRAKESVLAVAAAQSGGGDRSHRRLDLARFYLHNGLGAEALGQLKLAAQDDPNFAATGVYFLARGQAELMMGRAAEAATHLTQLDLAANPDALMWRGRALAELGKAQEAWQAFQAARMATLDLYSPGLQAQFRLAAARAAAGAGDLPAARKQLAALPEGLPDSLTAQAALISGRIAEREGDAATAFASYVKAVEHGEGATVAQARLHRVLVGRKLGKIAEPAAAEELERLRYAWRGDETERATIEALGQLYLDDGHYREAFAAFDEANRLFPGSPDADALDARMRETFADLFLDGKADKMEPVKALSLFLDYRHLTPIGREGDEMIRKLADRLVAVDLLDQAETLLEYQVKNRLEGVAKAQIATKLATLALLNHEPRRALEAIRETRQTMLPDTLNERRRMVEAQALMELGETDGALELIARYSGPDAKTLRAEIYWRARRWAEAARSYAELLPPNHGESGEIEASARQTVMKAAISYALAGDQAGLDGLRKDYRADMAKTADAAAFDVLTGPIDVEGATFRELAAKIAALDTLQGFLKSYKESL